MKTLYTYLSLMAIILFFSACSTTKAGKLGCPDFTQTCSAEKLYSKQKFKKKRKEKKKQQYAHLPNKHTKTILNQRLLKIKPNPVETLSFSNEIIIFSEETKGMIGGILFRF